jgi:hypothetical protein
MHTRKILIAAAAIAALSPAIAAASAESNALKACANAFASSLASSKDGTAPAFKLNYLSNQSAGSYAQYYSTGYTFFLKADDPKTGSPVASATCSATTGGTVLSLSADTQAQTLAAR